MLGLFGVLGVARRSLQTQRQGVEVAGHNLANVNNPSYSRQRLHIETSIPVPSTLGPQGTGVQATRIDQIRDALLDRQITSENSITGFLEVQQKALQYAEAGLGQQIDRNASGPEGSAASSGVGGQHGIAETLADLFAAFQSLSTNPSSLADRQVLVMTAQNLASKFNQVDDRLTNVSSALDDGMVTDVADANALLTQIAQLNGDILNAENSFRGVANDLRDTRQLRIEELSKLVKIDTSLDSAGAVNITIDGQLLVSRAAVLDTMQTYDAGGGRLMVRTATGATPLDLKSGAIQGAIDVRDGAIAGLRSDLDGLASALITEVNAVHAGGYSLSGSTGAAFFSGTSASTIGVNAALSSNPSLIQLSGVSGAAGDNLIALQLAQLATTPSTALSGQTYQQKYGRIVASIGQNISAVNNQMSDQGVVNAMLNRQRDSVSGVSLDEEMTDLMKFQTAYEASARLITTVDEMLQTLLTLKR